MRRVGRTVSCDLANSDIGGPSAIIPFDRDNLVVERPQIEAKGLPSIEMVPSGDLTRE